VWKKKFILHIETIVCAPSREIQFRIIFRTVCARERINAVTVGCPVNSGSEYSNIGLVWTRLMKTLLGEITVTDDGRGIARTVV